MRRATLLLAASPLLVAAGSRVGAAPSSAPTGRHLHFACIASYPDAAGAEGAMRAAAATAAHVGLGPLVTMPTTSGVDLCIGGFAGAADAFVAGATTLASQPLRTAGVVALSFHLVTTGAQDEQVPLDAALAARLGAAKEGLPVPGRVAATRAFVAPLPDSWVPDAAQASAVLAAGDPLLLLARNDSCDGDDCLYWYVAVYRDPGAAGYGLGYVMASQVTPEGAAGSGTGARAVVEPLFRDQGVETDRVVVEASDGTPRQESLVAGLHAGDLPLTLSWRRHQPVVRDAHGVVRWPR